MCRHKLSRLAKACLFFMCSMLYADDWADTEKLVASIAQGKTQTTAALASVIAESTSDPEQRLRMLYRWISLNIAYDADAFFSGTTQAQTGNEVLKKRKAVCAGYATLFAEVAEKFKVAAVVISGGVKGFGYVRGRELGAHAWNAVKLNGQWFLLDSTWGAGSIMDGKFVREFNPHFFLTPPELLAYTHLPADDKWQLLEQPISREEFISRVDLSSAFFNLGLSPQVVDPPTGVVYLERDQDFHFKLPGNFELVVFSGARSSKSHDRIEISAIDGHYVVPLAREKWRSGSVAIYARRPGEKSFYVRVLEYSIVRNITEHFTEQQLTQPLVVEQSCQRMGLKSDHFSIKTQAALADNNLELQINGPEEIAYVASLQHDGIDQPNNLILLATDSGRVLHAAFAATGMHQLNLFAKRSGESAGFEPCAAFQILVGRADPLNSVPKTFGSEMALKNMIYSPSQGLLDCSEEQQFSIKLPGITAAQIAIDGKFYEMKGEGTNEFMLKRTVSGKTITVYVSHDNVMNQNQSSGRQYRSILGYSCR
jgi:hypothetical protein